MADSYTADNVNKLAKQILAQGTTAKWTGGLDPQKSAMYMADDLAKSGITDISQVGKGENGIINKVTGQQLQSGYGERTKDNLWSGSFEGKGNTGFGVQFDAKGNPVFYTQGASSNDLVKMFQDDPLLGMVAQAGAAYFGGPLGTAALNAAMGKDLKDIAKSAALSYAGGEAAKAISGMNSVTDIFGKTGTDIAANTAKQFISSGGKADPLALLLSQGVSAGTNAVTSQIPGFTDLPDYAKTFVSKAVGNTIANKGNLSSEALMNAAMSAGLQASKTASTLGPGDMKQFSEDLLPGYFLPGGEGYMDPNAKNAGMSGSGYYDETNGKFINDVLGGLQNPLGSDTGNLDPNKAWEYNLTGKNVWTDKDGNSIDLSYLPNSETVLSGADLMARAGATAGGGSGNTTKVTPDTKTAATNNPASTGGSPQMIQTPSQDPYANIKSMEELFGGDIEYKLRSLGANTKQKTASSSMDDLAKLLRG